jgi:hypothetical protein
MRGGAVHARRSRSVARCPARRRSPAARHRGRGDMRRAGVGSGRRASGAARADDPVHASSLACGSDLRGAAPGGDSDRRWWSVFPGPSGSRLGFPRSPRGPRYPSATVRMPDATAGAPWPSTGLSTNEGQGGGFVDNCNPQRGRWGRPMDVSAQPVRPIAWCCEPADRVSGGPRRSPRRRTGPPRRARPPFGRSPGRGPRAA